MKHGDSSGSETPVRSGVVGLDRVLNGGLPAGEFYFVKGSAGTGKTTLGLQFLIEGRDSGQSGLYISLSQSRASLQKLAATHGWSLEGIQVEALDPSTNPETYQTVLDTTDVRLESLQEGIAGAISAAEPDRVVIDSLGVVRLLATDRYNYRVQLLRLKHMLSAQKCTSILLDEFDETDWSGLDGLSHGIIRLERTFPGFGDSQRMLWIEKMRGVDFHGGKHNFRIQTGGLVVYPRLRTLGNADRKQWVQRSSGIEELDRLAGGGLESGTTALVVGMPGTGKSSVAAQYAVTAARTGGKSAVFLFEEGTDTYFARCASLNMEIEPLVESGAVRIERVDSRRLSPGEFMEEVRVAIDEDEVEVVVIDSLTGYFHAMPQDPYPGTQLQELLNYASRRRVLTLLVEAWHGLGELVADAPIQVSYIADTVFLIQHYTIEGQNRKAISVSKKRHGPHDSHIHQLLVSERGIEIGPVITEFNSFARGNSSPPQGSSKVR